MPIEIDPTQAVCPDYTAATYLAARNAYKATTPAATDKSAAQFLSDIWKAGNDAERVVWQQQVDQRDVAAAAQAQLEKDAEDLANDLICQEQEASRKEEMKKNKAKYLPIPDRDVPIEASVIATNYAVCKMDKDLYVKMWYYTNDGLDEALHSPGTVDDEAMVMLRNSDSTTSWVPASSTKKNGLAA